MMRKKIALVLCAVMAFAMIGCNKPPAATQSVEIWGAPSSVKVMRDVDFADKKAARIDVSMAQNEYEAAQIFVTPKLAVSEYELTVSELTGSDGTKFPASQIEVFDQHYVDCKQTSNNFAHPLGWYPDAIIPFDKVKKAGENKIGAEHNQGIWVRFKSFDIDESGEYSYQEPGVYSGTFKLTVDGEETLIPVSVTVWDFCLPIETAARSIYMMYTDYITLCEGDSTIEMIEAYYEFFLDYRVSVANLPARNNDNEGLVAALRKYYPRMSAYRLPYIIDEKPDTYTQRDINWERLGEFLSLVVDASVEDGINYLDKAYHYDLFTDEYSLIIERQIYSAGVPDKMKAITLQTAENIDRIQGNSYIDTVDGLRNSLLNIKILSVSNLVEGVSEKFNVHCPTYDKVHEKRHLDAYKDLTSGENEELWWYGCVSPKNPYPTYHIDDDLLSSRILSWMQYDYEIVGDLFWQVTQYGIISSRKEVDPYGDVSRLGPGMSADTCGDGFLVYPGAKYDIYGPVGTIRLESIRDGKEEFEYLKILEEQYEAAQDYYSAALNYRSTTQAMFDSLYFGTKAGTDYNNFDSVRLDLGAAIVFTGGDEKLIVEKVEADPDKHTVSVLLASGYTVESEQLKSSEIAGQGNRYVFEIGKGTSDQVLHFSYTKNGVTKEYTKFIQKGVTIVNDLSQDLGDALTFTAGSTKSLDTISGTAVTKLVIANNGADEKLYPSFDLSLSSFTSRDNVEKITIDIYNAGEEFAISVTALGMTSNIPSGDFRINANGWTSLIMDPTNIIETARAIRFALPNDATRTIYIANLGYITR